jgi:uncharacterized coiled-coil DUF342 family protein
MLTQEDIKKIIKAQRGVFATKEDFDSFQEKMIKSFSNQQIAVDKYAKKADTYFQEMVMLSHKLEQHEKWFHQVAEKLGLKLEYF